MTVRVAERSTMTIDARFDPRANGLNAVRLLLASGVIIWHAFPVTGQDIPDGPLRQLLAFIWVDGFFAASGFLIVSSWMRRPNWWAFLSARLLRILPAFYTCLIVTAFADRSAGDLAVGLDVPAGLLDGGLSATCSRTPACASSSTA